MTPSGTRGIAKDAVAVYFADETLAAGFVARSCAGYRGEVTNAFDRNGDTGRCGK